MNLLVFHPDEFKTYYNCSLYNVDVIPLEKRKNFFVGFMLIAIFVIFEVLYIPTLFVFFTSKKLKGASFRLMMVLGMVDSAGIIITGLCHAIFSLNGTVYCSNPVVVFTVGFLCCALWFLENFIGVLLAFQRCLAMYNVHLANKLFENHKYLIWLFGIVVMVLLQSWFFAPSVFNSVKSAVFMNPHNGYDLANGDQLEQYFFPVFDGIVNVCIAIVLCTIYLLFFGIFRRKNIKYGVLQISGAEKNVFLQVVIISSLAVLVNLGLVFTQCFSDNRYIGMFTIISWPLYQGVPVIIYLTMNRTIREELQAVFWKRKKGMVTRSSQITPESLRFG